MDNLSQMMLSLVLNSDIGRSLKITFFDKAVEFYEVICITQKYERLCSGEKYVLLLPKIGNGMLYVITYDGILQAKLYLNECINFMTTALHREFRINKILND